jgi:RNA polymerase subunit RPABC4/transcription elongation factor Spt4
MFLIAGVQPKTKTLDKEARICPDCGLKTAHNQRVDHYFSLFFIPLLRVKKGVPVLTCARCGRARNFLSGPRCRHCGQTMDPAFKFCPFCGESAN